MKNGKIQNPIIPRYSGDLLWENSQPNSSFSGQTINFDASKYSKFDVIWKNNSSSTIYNVTTIYKGYRVNLITVNAGELLQRTSNKNGIHDSGVTFNNGLSINTYGNETTDNNECIPIKIIGFKTN